MASELLFTLLLHCFTQIEKSNQAFLIYQDYNGITQVNVRFEGEDVWLPVELIMELFVFLSCT